jgi:hypothetical protein
MHARQEQSLGNGKNAATQKAISACFELKFATNVAMERADKLAKRANSTCCNRLLMRVQRPPFKSSDNQEVLNSRIQNFKAQIYPKYRSGPHAELREIWALKTGFKKFESVQTRRI